MIGLPGELALAVVSGLLLNLTPCVLPVIPLKIRTIIHHAGAAPGPRAEAAIVFATGTLLFFLTIGIATALLHWTWGALFRSPLTIAVLVVMMASFAAMILLDITMPVPGFAYRTGRGRLLEPFISGGLAAILSTPCTGPFLGSVLAFAITQPPSIVITIFMCVGIGLALPYVVILLRPSLLAYLPRAGEWSHRLHQALAFVLLAGAVFFAQSLVSPDFGLWLWRIWAIGLLLWASTLVLRKTTWATRMVVIGFATVALSTSYAGGLLMPSHAGPLHWRPFAPWRLATARRTHRPVLLEFTAAWCINCRILEKTVYVDRAFVRAARQVHMLALRVDLTRPNQSLEHLLVKDGGAGLPFAVIRNREGRITKRFAGIFTSTSLIQAIHQAATATSGRTE
ncbi:MAG: DUF255 domain-containing protein [Proteobacteria bacterium]|nr:DUF255 domain-containing protein [Pseudomonadota bacterium]